MKTTAQLRTFWKNLISSSSARQRRRLGDISRSPSVSVVNTETQILVELRPSANEHEALCQRDEPQDGISHPHNDRPDTIPRRNIIDLTADISEVVDLTSTTAVAARSPDVVDLTTDTLDVVDLTSATSIAARSPAVVNFTADISEIVDILRTLSSLARKNDDLESRLRCPICYEISDVRQVMPCGHSMCPDCYTNTIIEDGIILLLPEEMEITNRQISCGRPKECIRRCPNCRKVHWRDSLKIYI